MYTRTVATRLRGVRWMNPSWMRNGSYTSSRVETSSPIATARDEMDGRVLQTIIEKFEGSRRPSVS